MEEMLTTTSLSRYISQHSVIHDDLMGSERRLCNHQEQWRAVLLLTIESTPGPVCFSLKFSSLNVSPYIDSPPVPLPRVKSPPWIHDHLLESSLGSKTTVVPSMFAVKGKRNVTFLLLSTCSHRKWKGRLRKLPARDMKFRRREDGKKWAKGEWISYLSTRRKTQPPSSAAELTQNYKIK